MEKPNNDLKNNQHSDARPGEGIRTLKTSNVFRTLNFELYARPVSINDRMIDRRCISYHVVENVYIHCKD